MKAVVVHRGARDAYQVARALAEGGQLQRLVTDLYWPAHRLARVLPARLQNLLNARCAPGLDSSLVACRWFTGLFSLACEKLPHLPFELRRRAMRWCDRSLGETAGLLARKESALLLSYSYYGYSSFSAYGRPGILFQLHPHPASVRRILQEELQSHPETASSLEKEWELALPEEEFQRLVAEVRMADGWIVASSFTRQTLIENGIPAGLIALTPYGVDPELFHPAPARLRAGIAHRPLRLLFVGRMVQRKGISYLLDALRHFPARDVELTVAGRAVDNLALLRKLGDRINIRCSVTAQELQSLYQSSDLLVLPSVAEGFGQVLLEALASGLPVLSTTSTAAPDLISQGFEGWFVEPRRADRLAEHIHWALTHRSRLESMRSAARDRACQMTWQRFRSQVRDAVGTLRTTTTAQLETVHV